MELKNKLKEYRAKKDITQDELAKDLNISQQTILSIEKEKYTPSTLLAFRLAAYFRVKVDDLFYLEKGEN